MRMGPEATGLTTSIYDWQDVILSLNICVYIYITQSPSLTHVSCETPLSAFTNCLDIDYSCA